MRRADDQELQRVLSEALDSVPVPEMAWASIATNVHGSKSRPRATKNGRWWASSAAVATLLVVVAFGSQSIGFTQATRVFRAVSVAARPNCAVTFSLSGIILQPKGYVSVTTSLGTPPFVAATSGSGFKGPCGTVLSLTQHPAHAEDVFVGWVVSKRPGAFAPVRGRPSTIRLTLTGKNEVVYLKYVVRGP